MKVSKKLKKELKKRILTSISSILIILMLFAGSRIDTIANSFEKMMGAEESAGVAETEEAVAVASSNVTYIYTAQDLVAFRNAVNAGNTYAGKTVYLMNDINLNTVCSSTLGSWVPIGTSSSYFSGTFDGNYHTISNLYINTSAYTYAGLFRINQTTSIIQNLNMSNVYIYI